MLERSGSRRGARDASRGPTCRSCRSTARGERTACTGCWRQTLARRARAASSPDAAAGLHRRARRLAAARRATSTAPCAMPSPPTTPRAPARSCGRPRRQPVAHGEAAAVERRLERFTRAPDRRDARARARRRDAQLAAGRGDLVAHWASAAAASGAAPTVAGRRRRRRAHARRARPRRPGARDRGRRARRGAAARRRPVRGALPTARRARRTTWPAIATQAARELEAGARRAAVTAPAAPRALPGAARRARPRARRLGRGRRARRACAGAGRAPRPRRTCPRPRSCSPSRRSCAPTRGAPRSAPRPRRRDAAAGALVDFAPWYDAELRDPLRAGRVAPVRRGRSRARACSTPTRFAPARARARRSLAAWLDESHEQLAAATAPDAAPPASLTAAELRILALPADAPLLPRDRRADPRLGQHGQDAGQRRLPQARRLVALGGRHLRAGARRARPGWKYKLPRLSP